MATATLESVRAAKPAAQKVFAALADVAGVGITRIGDGYGVKVNLRAAPAAGVVLPAEVEGVPVRVEVVGTIRKLGAED